MDCSVTLQSLINHIPPRYSPPGSSQSILPFSLKGKNSVLGVARGLTWFGVFLLQETSEAERRRIGAEFERLHRFLAEKERAVLGRLAELDAAFEAAQAEKSLRVAEGITRLHGLIGQLEVKRTPQVRTLLTEKLPKSAAHGVLTPLFPLILGYREHPKQVCGIWSLPPLCHPECGGAGLGLNIPPVTSPPPLFLFSAGAK